jgi:uncharacterized protein (TIGR02646 family)
MRPVDKGTAPVALYAKYEDAAPDLVARLGRYCSYCERQIETHLAVEHVQPKSLVRSLRTVWSNFLLGCVNCNSCKGTTAITLGDYFWPDTDNTLRAFEYVSGGLIKAHSSLNETDQVKAVASIGLTGLDRFPGSPAGDPTKADLRWQRRREAWNLANKCVDRLNSNNTIEVRELIVETAIGRGMFSIWWTVFAGDADMRRRLREAFIGTDAGSFNGNEDAVPRQGGSL